MIMCINEMNDMRNAFLSSYNLALSKPNSSMFSRNTKTIDSLISLFDVNYSSNPKAMYVVPDHAVGLPKTSGA